MIDAPDVCATCGAGDLCADCFGSGAAPGGPAGSCVSCGGSGTEPSMLPACSQDRCGVPMPGPGQEERR